MVFKLKQLFQKVEEKERQDAMTVPLPKKKGVFGKGRGTGKAGNVAEYLPSAQGRCYCNTSNHFDCFLQILS